MGVGQGGVACAEGHQYVVKENAEYGEVYAGVDDYEHQ